MDATVAKAQALPESSAAQSAEPGECRINGASPIQEAESRKTGAMPSPKSDLGCALIGIYAKAMLDDLLGKAIFDEAEGSGK